MNQRKVMLSLALAAWLGGTMTPARPESPGQAPSRPVFQEQIEVHILNVDVAVTDRKGEPIYGLDKDDFTVTVDGKSVPLENFYASEPALQQPETEEAAGPVERAQTPAQVPPEQHLHLAVIIDTQRLLPAERNRVIHDLAAQLQKGLRPGDQILVATYDGGLQVSQAFTGDWQRVADNLAGLTRQVSGGMGAEQEQRNILRDLAEGASPSSGGADAAMALEEAHQLLGSIRLYSRQAALQIKQTVGALDAFVDGLGGIAGRKVVLFVTTGMEERPGRALLNAFENKYPGVARREEGIKSTDLATGEESTRDLFRELVARANAKRVSFYTIATAGAGVTQAVSGERGGGYEAGNGGGGVWTAALDAGYRADMGAPLAMIAEDTGGRALVNSSNYDQLVQWVRQDASSYYSLGIRAPEASGKEPQGGYQIRVRVDRPDAQIRYRRQAAVRSEKEKAADTTLADLLYGTGANPLAIAAQFGPAQTQGKKKELLQPVLVKIPFVKLTLLPQPRFHEGKVTIFVVAEDREGRVSPVQSVEAPIRIPEDKLQAALRGVAGYRVGLLVRPGPQEIAIGVRDEIGNVTSTIRLHHDVETTHPPS